MYNTVREAFTPAGPCPASHPVRVPQLAFETLWDTTEFNQWWPEDGSQPFVLSYGDGGDSLGYGTHADYVFGWKGDALQRAMDSDCMFQGCENGRPLKSQSVAQMNACRVKDFVGEDIDSCEFPGNLKRAGVEDDADMSQGSSTSPVRTQRSFDVGKLDDAEGWRVLRSSCVRCACLGHLLSSRRSSALLRVQSSLLDICSFSSCD